MNAGLTGTPAHLPSFLPIAAGTSSVGVFRRPNGIGPPLGVPSFTCT